MVVLTVGLVVVTAIATAVVEGLNWWYAEDGGWGLFVRTAWGLVRALGLLVVARQAWRGRASAAPFGLILTMTTIFSVGRLVVPKTGYPQTPGIIGFAVITVLCIAVMAMLYRPRTVRGFLVQPPNRLVLTRQGIQWRPATTTRRIPGWRLTARVAVLSYGPLMLVAALVGIGVVGRRPIVLPFVVVWLVAALLVANASTLATMFMLRGQAWARVALVALTVAVLAIDLPFCWLILGSDGLVRDGAPVALCALLALVGLGRGYRPQAVA